MEKESTTRKNTRLQGFDYNAAGAYFITICTENRRHILSRIVVGGDVLDAPHASDVPDAPFTSNFAPSVELLEHGKIADKYINQLSEFYHDIKVARYVIMPDHIHLLLHVLGDGASRTSLANEDGALPMSGASRTSPPTVKQHSLVPRFVSTLKRFCNKEYGYNIWQRNYYDHIIRSREDYEEHLKYIYENPLHRYYDELYTEEQRG